MASTPSTLSRLVDRLEKSLPSSKCCLSCNSYFHFTFNKMAMKRSFRKSQLIAFDNVAAGQYVIHNLSCTCALSNRFSTAMEYSQIHQENSSSSLASNPRSSSTSPFLPILTLSQMSQPSLERSPSVQTPPQLRQLVLSSCQTTRP